MMSNYSKSDHGICCVPGCAESGDSQPVRHLFPNPKKQPDRFKSWLNAIGGDILGLDDPFIHANRRVCDGHFEEKYFCHFNRLSQASVPTLNLPGQQRTPYLRLRSPAPKLEHIASTSNAMSMNDACMGCLSTDRRLSVLTDDDQKTLFTQLVDLCYQDDCVLLCWECRACVRRALNFKQRVKEAAQVLALYGRDLPADIKYSSNLKNTEVTFTSSYDEICTREPVSFVKVEGCGDDLQVDDGTMDVELPETEAFDSLDFINDEVQQSACDSDDIPLNKVTKVRKKRTHKRKPEEKKRGKQPRVLQALNVDSSMVEMVILSWDEVERDRQQALLSDAFTRHVYKCEDCVLGFNHKFKLDNHMRKHDQSAGSLCCSVCRVRFTSSSALSSHRRRHVVRWRCVACGQSSSRPAVAADHVAREHGGTSPVHTCSSCGHVAATLGKLRIHLKSHMERQKCELCGKTFKGRTSLMTHLFIHKGEKEYSCPRCDKKFLFKKAMEVHALTHEQNARLYCYECDVTFKNKMSYYQHMRCSLKHIDPAKLKFACEICEKRFSKAIRLQEHYLAVHLKETPILCPVEECGFACSSRPVLRSHTRTVHRKVRAARNHVCDTCGKAYTTKRTLEGHMRSHTGERPYKCKLCPSTFGYEAALYNHNKLVHLKMKKKLGPALGPDLGPSWALAIELQDETVS